MHYKFYFFSFMYCLVLRQVGSFGFPRSSLLRKKIDESIQVLLTPWRDLRVQTSIPTCDLFHLLCFWTLSLSNISFSYFLKLSFLHFLSLFPELVRFSIVLPLLAKHFFITIFLYNILNSAAFLCIILIILNSAVSPWLSLVSAGVFSYKLADTN